MMLIQRVTMKLGIQRLSMIFGLLMLGMVTLCFAQEEAVGRTVSVQGIGVVSRVPDRAVIRVGVTTEAPEPAAAMNENAMRMENILKAVKTIGGDALEISTDRISLQPQYRYVRDRAGNNRQELTGYQAANYIRMRTDGLENLSALITASLAKGGNRLEGLSFEIGDRDIAEREARKLAVEDARQKATLYAHEVDGTLGKVLSIKELSSGGSVPRARSMRVMADSAVPTPVEAGSQQVRIQVDMVFDLE